MAFPRIYPGFPMVRFPSPTTPRWRSPARSPVWITSLRRGCGGSRRRGNIQWTYSDKNIILQYIIYVCIWYIYIWYMIYDIWYMIYIYIWYIICNYIMIRVYNIYIYNYICNGVVKQVRTRFRELTKSWIPCGSLCSGGFFSWAAWWAARKLIWLVVWNMTFIFPHIGLGTILPTDFHIFQRGLNHQPVMIQAVVVYYWSIYLGKFNRDRTLFSRSLEWWLVGGNNREIIPKLAEQFRLVKYHNLPRYMAKMWRRVGLSEGLVILCVWVFWYCCCPHHYH